MKDDLLVLIIVMGILSLVAIPVYLWFGWKWAITVFCILLVLNIISALRKYS